MKFSLIDTVRLDSECLEESDFDTERDRIQNRVNAIVNAGGLVAPIICFPNGLDDEGQQVFEAFEEESNLLNTLAMIKLYRQEPRRWHLSNAWVVDNIDQAEVLAQQYLLICGIE
ncbi:MAG: hypothetical protein AAFR83_15610 [Cyanobacteria bacterium J06629_18]